MAGQEGFRFADDPRADPVLRAAAIDGDDDGPAAVCRDVVKTYRTATESGTALDGVTLAQRHQERGVGTNFRQRSQRRCTNECRGVVHRLDENLQRARVSRPHLAERGDRGLARLPPSVLGDSQEVRHGSARARTEPPEHANGRHARLWRTGGAKCGAHRLHDRRTVLLWSAALTSVAVLPALRMREWEAAPRGARVYPRSRFLALYLSAFVTNTASHVLHGLWRAPEAHNHEIISLRHWTPLAAEVDTPAKAALIIEPRAA